MSVSHLSNKINKNLPKERHPLTREHNKYFSQVVCKKSATYLEYCSSHDRQAFSRSIRAFRVLDLYLVSVLAARAVGPIDRTDETERVRQKKQANKNKNSRNSGQVHTRRSRHA